MNEKQDAKAAKRAYKASRPWYKKKRFMIPLALVVLIVIASAASSGGGSDDSSNTAASSSNDNSSSSTDSSKAPATHKAKPTHKAAKPKPKPKPKPAVKAMPVDAGVMLKEFDGNEAAADAKYKGKTLKVTGKVDKVDTELLDDNQYIIRLTGGDPYAIVSVNCNDISESAAAKVQKGSYTTVVGKFDDGGDLGVELKNCSLSK